MTRETWALYGQDWPRPMIPYGVSVRIDPADYPSRDAAAAALAALVGRPDNRADYLRTAPGEYRGDPNRQAVVFCRLYVSQESD